MNKFTTEQYIQRLINCKPGTKVRVIKGIDTEDILTIGGFCHATPTGSNFNRQKLWVGIKETNDGYIIGDTYQFEIIENKDYICYEPKNKPAL